MNLRRAIVLISILVAATTVWAASTNAPLPFISPMFGDNMVLQRGKPNTIWGWAKPKQVVRVEIAGRSAKAVAGADGRWQVTIKPPPIGGPYTIVIEGERKVELHNVLVGDVWLCGGQSNMEFPLGRALNGGEEVKAANYPQIRFFNVKQQSAYAPGPLAEGSWKVCSPQTVTEEGGISAVGYYFARAIQNEVNVPIGLIKDCVGGTPAESWTSAETLRQRGDFTDALNEIDRLRAKGGPVYGNYVMPWYDEFDIGQKGATWAAADLPAEGWTTVTVPGGFGELGVRETPAVCYFRKIIRLPDPLPPGAATIRLGVIEKMDTTWINGQWVGASAWVENPRAYVIRDKVLKPGANVITVRVFKTKPVGGFQSNPADLKLVLGDKTEIPLSGEWQGRVAVDARPPHPLPMGFENWPVMPTVLYNGMIAPVAPLAITGALWYQGEANVGRGSQYQTLLPAMIADWRKLFGQGNFPFYIVSLAAFTPHRNTPGNDAWAELREAQAIAARTVRNSGLAVTIDVGDPNDIHPRDKKVVGERLARHALADRYGKKVVRSGPTFASVKKSAGALKIRFKNTGGGLVIKGDKPSEFAIAAGDKKWFWADAKVEGDAIVVSSPQVPHPVAVRYAWQGYPTANVFNGAGLPAVPFRTDDW